MLYKYQNGYLELDGVYVLSGPPREILHGGTRLIWDPGDKLRLLLNGLPSCNVNVSDDQLPEFRSLSDFYIIIFLKKLKIVENTPRKMIKSK